MFLLGGCGTTYTESGAKGLPESSLAILTWDWTVDVHSIDRDRDKFLSGLVGGAPTRAALLPGEHRISYSIGGPQNGIRRGVAVIDLKPGHQYRLKDVIYWFSSVDRWKFWIEDETTGEVVYGRR
jgi:hypothetical protein